MNLSKSLCSLHHHVLISVSPYLQSISSGYPSESLAVKHRQLARQLGAFIDDHRKNLMAPLDNNVVPAKGTTFFVGSWVFVANGSGGFDSHLIDPRAPKTSEAARRRAVDEFVDQLEKIPLSVHVKEVWKQPDFDVTAISTKSPSEGYPSESLAVKHRHSLWYPPKEA